MLRLLRHLAPYRWSIAAALVLIFIQSLAELYLPTLMAGIVDSGVTRGDTHFILWAGARMLLVTLGSVACSILSAWLASRVSMAFGRDLRGRLFEKVAGFSLHAFDRFGAATLLTRTTNDVTQVQTFTLMLFRMLVAAPLMCIGGLVMAISMDRHLSVVLLASVPALVAAIAFIAVRGVKLFRRMQDKLDRLNLVLRESLIGVRVIRAFNRVGSDQARFEGASRDLADTALAAQRTMALLMPTMMVAMNLTTLAILWFGGQRIDAGQAHVGGMMAFVQYATQILFSLMMVSIMFVFLPRASVSAGRINEVLEISPEITDPPMPRALEKVRGEVEFRDVVYRYPGAEEPALQHVSFTAAPGEVTAIIGGTGSGKSTLAGLVPRFFDVESGAVLIDGVDVRELRQAELRRHIGFVPQKAVLFSDSVAGNIRYGREDATDDEVRQAAATAQAAEFIEARPEGYAAPVAQGGLNLSGGQKQRLSIARALARRPAIYVFDDSFSALDFKTDSALRRALKEDVRDATVLIVAQRVSTVMDADRIVVLEDGKVAGIGRHEALMRDCAVYREIVASQLSPKEAA
ncbi:MAG TPA: ABC transporter ATP-binding protein [Myxococcales bacterium]